MNENTTIEGVGDVIKELRTQEKLTLDELADRLDWDKSRLSKYENNKLGLSLDAIEKIAVALRLRAEPVILRCLQCRYPALSSPRSKAGKLLTEAVEHMLKDSR